MHARPVATVAPEYRRESLRPESRAASSTLHNLDYHAYALPSLHKSQPRSASTEKLCPRSDLFLLISHLELGGVRGEGEHRGESRQSRELDHLELERGVWKRKRRRSEVRGSGSGSGCEWSVGWLQVWCRFGC